MLREIRNDVTDEDEGERLTRVGDDGRWKTELAMEDDEDEVKVDGRGAFEIGSDGEDEAENLPEGEIDRGKENLRGSTGAFERDLEDDPIDEHAESLARREKGVERSGLERDRDRGAFFQLRPQWGDSLANCMTRGGMRDL